MGVRLTRRVREEYLVYFDRNATMSGAKRRGSAGMHRRSNAAWVSPQAASPLAARGAGKARGRSAAWRAGSGTGSRAGVLSVGEVARRPGNAGVHTGTAARRAARSRIANREEARGRLGTPASGRHRCATAQRDGVSPMAQKRGDGLERRPPAGITRERETSADDTGPCQRECRTPSQHPMPRPLTAPPTRAAPFSCQAGCK